MAGRPLSALCHPAAMEPSGIVYRQVEGTKLVERARELFREYSLGIGVDLEYQGFAGELAALPFPYIPPKGALLLAFAGGQVAGCVGLRPIDFAIGEMKRLYVRPAYRKFGIGEGLVERVARAARTANYRELRLDTLSSMHSAQALYRRLGFEETLPYSNNYLVGTRFYALNLTS